ncbi:protein ITPRID2 [Pholidichthys leucotaenia]
MESGAVEASPALDTRVKPANMACLRRRAWAMSKDSIQQDSEAERCDPQGPQQSQSNGETQKPSEEPGQVPNKIASWLNECRTPLGASLDDQSPFPSKGAQRNGCSFEDDLSLGAEANHLRSSNDNNETEPCFGLAAEQKRSQYKERGRSVNSTGSGKSSTVSSVSELLDLYEEDPEEILLNLGFGHEEPDLSSKIPSRFFNSTSSARGIDIKVYLGAQLQRMELENPSYALTSRFRQIEVLTTVANEFFQLYSQVSGQPLQRISTKDQDGDEGGKGGGGGGGNNEQSPRLKKKNSALNVAKFLKKTISKHNLLAATPETPEAVTPNPDAQLNGHNTSDHTHTGTEQDGSSSDSDHQVETVTLKHIRKRENSSLATVKEETSGEGETDLMDNRPEQSSTAEERQPESVDPQPPNQTTENKGTRLVSEEERLTSIPEKAPPTLTLPHLAQLRVENADSFDMEEIQSNEDEVLPHRTTRTSDLLRTVSQQSDSSGFAEEPSADSNGYLKVQESSDSCDSETTVTSHPSQDLPTPIALDQPAFELPDIRGEEPESSSTAKADGSSSPVQIPQYTAHHLPHSSPTGTQQDETQDEEQVESGESTDPDPEQETAQSVPAAEQQLRQELEVTQNQSVSEEEPQNMQISTNTEGGSGEDQTQLESVLLEDSSELRPLPPSSPVLKALNRAKQQQLSSTGSQSSRATRGRRGMFPVQRSSSLPSSLLSPSRVVSSVRIQFGKGQTSCTQPRYSFKYTQEVAGDQEKEEGEENRETSCLSTLIINPTSSRDSNKIPPSASPPKPIPHYLTCSSYSLQTASTPPPDWSTGGHPWSTQSVPDFPSHQEQLDHLQQNQRFNQQRWNPGQPFPGPLTSAQDSDSNPNSSPRFNSSPYHFTVNTHPPSGFHPYGSLPNLLHPPTSSLHHHSSLTSLHRPFTPLVHPHTSMSNLNETSSPAVSRHASLGHSHPGNPSVPPQAYGHPFSHQSPYSVSPHSPHFTSPYLGYHVNPQMGFHPAVHPHSPFFPEHSLHPGLAPPVPDFLTGPGLFLSPGRNLHMGVAAPGPVPSQGPSSTEMQLRRVLHEIRGTVQSLNQNQADTPDGFNDHRSALPTHQSLAELQQKRRSLNLFRSQMMDLEMLILRQQAPAYNHMSPAERLELEQLQSLRSAVREELQELEQQLEDKLMEMTEHTRRRSLHRGSSVDSLYATSALRALEPVSDLLREQLFLQSELSSDRHTPLIEPSPRSASPVRGGGDEVDAEQRQEVYRASINITPAPPPRPNTQTERAVEGEEDNEGEEEQQQGAAGYAGLDNLQQLIREIRESVAQEVRREIYSELLAAVSPRHSPLPARQQPL